MDTVWQDLRYALRQFVRRPGFTAVAVLSLGIAIGANSLIYGLVDGFVFHPFPYPQPDRLVAVGVTFPKLSSETTYVESLSPAEYLDVRASRSFAHTGSFDLGNRNLSGGDVPERVFTVRTVPRRRSSAIGCGSRDSAAIPGFSIARFESVAARVQLSASCRQGCC